MYKMEWKAHVSNTTFICFCEPKICYLLKFRSLLLRTHLFWRLRFPTTFRILRMAWEEKSDELFLVDYYDATQKARVEKITEKSWLANLMTLKTVKSLILKKMSIMPKLGPGNQAMLSSASHPWRRGISRWWRTNILWYFYCEAWWREHSPAS